MGEEESGALEALPEAGLVFWPVGNGDSSTVCVTIDTVFQVDLNHVESADDDDSVNAAVVDELERLLPRKNGRPYLAAFALTHPDQDHCRGFPTLVDRVDIGEIWFTPRVFREYKKDLCSDAAAFRDEAMRRVKVTVESAAEVDSGDRVRVVGYDELLQEDDFEGFPPERLSHPGEAVTELDRQELEGNFRAFLHAPFKDDADGDRNDTSLAMQVTLGAEGSASTILLLGDLSYPVLRKIFDRSDESDLAWSVLLAPHHCSKSTMYWKKEGEDEETLRDDILNDIKAAAGNPGTIISSSKPVPSSNEPGDNPPHAKAKNRYEEIAPGGFLCTQEHPDEDAPEPIVFEASDEGLSHRDAAKGDSPLKTLGAAVTAARGAEAPPSERVGFGRER